MSYFSMTLCTYRDLDVHIHICAIIKFWLDKIDCEVRIEFSSNKNHI